MPGAGCEPRRQPGVAIIRVREQSTAQPVRLPAGRARADLGAFGHGQFRTDYEDRGDLAALHDKRVERVQAALAGSELDCLLLWKDENVRYLTGMRAQIISGKSALLNGVLLLFTNQVASGVVQILWSLLIVVLLFTRRANGFFAGR